MAIRSRKKGLAEVNLTSMTDIIFMLLIFFMLTSTLVKMVPFELAESDSRAKAPIKVTVELMKDGTMEVNDVPVTDESVESEITKAVKEKSATDAEITVTIVAEKGVTFDRITPIMRISNRIGTKAILATQPRE